MVLPHSHRIPRVLCYSGYLYALFDFGYEAITLFRLTFQLCSPIKLSQMMRSEPLRYFYLRFGLLQFRSPLLSQSFVYFLFLHLLRCFSSVGSPHNTMYSCYDNWILIQLCCHIRKSTGHRLCASHRSLSQLVTSFFGA